MILYTLGVLTGLLAFTAFFLCAWYFSSAKRTVTPLTRATNAIQTKLGAKAEFVEPISEEERIAQLLGDLPTEDDL